MSMTYQGKEVRQVGKGYSRNQESRNYALGGYDERLKKERSFGCGKGFLSYVEELNCILTVTGYCVFLSRLTERDS